MHYKEEGVFEILSERKDNFGRVMKSGFRRSYPRTQTYAEPQFMPPQCVQPQYMQPYYVQPQYVQPQYEPQPYYRAVLRPVYIGQWANNLIWFALGFLGVPLLRLMLLAQ